MRFSHCSLAAVLVVALSFGINAQQGEESPPEGLVPEPPAPSGSGASAEPGDLVVGTGGFGGKVVNDTFVVDPETGTSMSFMSGVPYWGATYDAANDRVLFTTSLGGVDGTELYEIPAGGGMPTQIGQITGPTGAGLRIDGLAMSGGTLYGVHQFNDEDGAPGLYSIDMGTLEATQETSLTAGAVSGIDADPETGIIYGVNDTAGELQQLNLDGTTVTIAAYPGGETDIDGLGVGNGTAYLVPDESGDMYPYDLAADSYGTPITSPFSAADTFSGAAVVTGSQLPPAPAIPTLNRVGLWLLVGAVLIGGLLVGRQRFASPH